MNPPAHFLERMHRLTPQEAALAQELGRDAKAVRGFLAEVHARDPALPHAERYALPLSGLPQPAFLLVSQDGGPVTCLAAQMTPDVPVIPFAMVDSFARALRERVQAAITATRTTQTPDVLDRLATEAHLLTTSDWTLLEALVPLIGELLLECVRTGVELLRTDLPQKIAPRPRENLPLCRQWWPRYLCAAHAMLLGGRRVFDAQMVVLHTATPDVYVSTRALWCAARRGAETLDVLENLARREGLLGGEHELAVAVALDQPLWAGRVRRFLKEFRHREGAGYLQLLERALEDPRGALDRSTVALLPLLPSILVPERVAQDATLSAAALVEAQRQIPSVHTMEARAVAARLHPELDVLLQRWFDDDAQVSLPIWRSLLRNSVVRPNLLPFGTLLFARAPYEALLPDDSSIEAWSLDAGARYIRDVMVSFVPPPRPVESTERPGPNSPCHCGSGKKYKKCHMQADEDARRR